MSCPKIVRIVTPGPPGPGLTLTGPALAGRTTGTGGLVSISLGAGLSIVDGALTLTGAGSGTVTSVGLSVPAGFSVGNSPITGSGTLALSFATGYSLPTTAKQGQWDQAYADLGQARPPSSHKSTHATGGTDALSPGDIGAATAAQGAKADSAIQPGNAALTDAREWSAETISQAEAEAGSATTRRAFTAQRVFQAVAAWWAGSASKTKLDGIANGATANSTDAQLRDRSTHTGTQTAATISDFAASASAAAPVQSVAGRTGTVALAKGDVGLGNADNTSDADKPISTATAAALAGKEDYYPLRQTLTAASGTYTLNVTSGKEFTTGAAINGATTINLSGLTSIPANGVWRGVLRFAYTSGAISWFTGNTGYTVKWDGNLTMTPTAGETEAVIIEVVGGSATIEVVALRGRT